MADNYLENRYDAVFGKKTVTKRVGHTLDELLLKNRSTRGYYKPYVVKTEELEQIVSVNTKIPSGRNQQALRFRLVTVGSDAQQVLKNIKMGAALPELHLPFQGTEPEAFIVVCPVSDNATPLLYVDLGISLQSMSLRAVEMGLNTLIVFAFNKAAIRDALNLPTDPLAVLCVGKGSEKVKLVSIHEGDSQAYYRLPDGTHCVPKLTMKDLLI